MIAMIATALQIAELCDSRQSPRLARAPGGFAVLIDRMGAAHLPGCPVIGMEDRDGSHSQEP
jgi:hypothetical protein